MSRFGIFLIVLVLCGLSIAHTCKCIEFYGEPVMVCSKHETDEGMRYTGDATGDEPCTETGYNLILQARHDVMYQYRCKTKEEYDSVRVGDVCSINAKDGLITMFHPRPEIYPGNPWE